MDFFKIATRVFTGVGLNYEAPHKEIRELFRIGEGGFTKTKYGIHEMMHIFPKIELGIDKDRRDELARNFDYGTDVIVDRAQKICEKLLCPNADRNRDDREGGRTFDQNDAPKSISSRAGDGPQLLYTYYASPSSNAMLAVAVVDKLGDKLGEYGNPIEQGTALENVKFGILAELKNWTAGEENADETQMEFEKAVITNLIIDGKATPICSNTIKAAMDYARNLTSMVFHDNPEQDYDPAQAMEDTLAKYGEDVFNVSTLQALRSGTSYSDNNEKANLALDI
jgi:hypothetical protein